MGNRFWFSARPLSRCVAGKEVPQPMIPFSEGGALLGVVKPLFLGSNRLEVLPRPSIKGKPRTGMGPSESGKRLGSPQAP